MKSRFYELMEFDPARGVSSRDRLMALGLKQEAEFIWPQTLSE